jgi:hypothetical protein
MNKSLLVTNFQERIDEILSKYILVNQKLVKVENTKSKQRNANFLHFEESTSPKIKELIYVVKDSPSQKQ